MVRQYFDYCPSQYRREPQQQYRNIELPRRSPLALLGLDGSPERTPIKTAAQAADAISLLRPEYARQTQLVKEGIQSLAAFAGSGTLNAFTGDYGLWQTVSGGQGAAGGFFALYYLLNTIWFNRIQRYTARYLLISNGIAKPCLHYMTTLALGEGFEYKGKSEAADKIIKQWIKLNKWHQRSKRLFREYKTQGEVFIRIFGEPPYTEVRTIDPDFIYSSQDVKQGVGDKYQGIVGMTHDDTEVDYYEVHDNSVYGVGGETEEVPAREMQHRADLLFNERRGRSHFLPVFPQMFQVDQLSTDLLATASVQSKFPFLLKIDAPNESIDAMDMNIPLGPGSGLMGGNGQAIGFGGINQANYGAGQVPFTSENIAVEKVGADNFGQWIEPMNFAMHMIATCCFLPAEIISQIRESSAPYNGAIVESSWQERGVRGEQDDWKRYDLDLICRCTGIDEDDIEVTAPAVATPDKKGAADILFGAVDRMILSRNTAQLRLEADPEEENKYLAMEQKQDDERAFRQAEQQAKLQGPGPGETSNGEAKE